MSARDLKIEARVPDMHSSLLTTRTAVSLLQRETLKSGCVLCLRVLTFD